MDHTGGWFALAMALAAALVGCSPVPAATPTDPDVVVRLPASWPAHPAAPAAVAVAQHALCGGGVAPVVGSDDRGFGVVFLLMGTPQDSGDCELLEQADGSFVALTGGRSQSFDPVPEDELAITVNGVGPPWTPERASANPQIEWRDLMGFAPVGTAEVRAAVDGHAVEATLGGRLFVVAWPNATEASLLVALDADGRELARLDAEALHVRSLPNSFGPSP